MVKPEATLAVTIPPAEVPQVTWLAFEKFSVEKRKEPALLLTATGCTVCAGKEALADIMLPALVPKVTLFELEKTNTPYWKLPLAALKTTF